MKNLKLLLLLLLFFNLCRSQSVDSLEYDDEYDYTVQLGTCVYKSYKVNYVDSVDSNSVMKSSILTTNLVTNIEILDSINRYRVNIGVEPVNDKIDVYDYNMSSFIEQISMGVSDSDSSNLVLRKIEIYKACECASSIYNIIMDSTLTFDKIPLSKFLGDKRVKRIDVVYAQVFLQRPYPHDVEYLYLKVYRKFRLFPRGYNIDLTDYEEEEIIEKD